MKINSYPALILFMSIGLAGCKQRSSAPDYPDEVYYRNAIMNKDKISAASKRALERNYDQGPEWFVEFRTAELIGDFAYEASLMISIMFTIPGPLAKPLTGTGDPERKVFPWDKTEIWYATSTDVWEWEEQGQAVDGTTGP
jgi:hypothetical protein